MTILRSGVATATTIAALCFNVGPNLVAAPLNMKSEAEHTTVSASYVASSAKADEFSRRESSAFAGEEVNAEAPETQQANSENFASNQAAPLDAFGYLGGLFEARFYQAHATTDDPRDEIREAASLYGVDAVMMMSIAKVESDFNPRVRTGSYKGLFQLSDHEFNKYGDGSIWDARDNARPRHTCFWFKPNSSDGRLVTTQILQRDTWYISRVSKALLNITYIPSGLHGNRCVRPTRAS
jgi:soluble lytic murein transglycosylase-like protein